MLMNQQMFFFITKVVCFFFRKEHKSHSPSCHFIALKKKVEELTVEEFFKLQKERHIFIVVCSFMAHHIYFYVFSYQQVIQIMKFWTDSDFHSQNKRGNEATAKFEEAAKLRRAEIIKTAMGEEWNGNGSRRCSRVESEMIDIVSILCFAFNVYCFLYSFFKFFSFNAIGHVLVCGTKRVCSPQIKQDFFTVTDSGFFFLLCCHKKV